MNIQEINKTLTDAIEIYGEDSQIWMAIEEMSELSNALAKYRRGRVTREDVCEEEQCERKVSLCDAGNRRGDADGCGGSLH